ncbi:MAG: YfiH family protein [Paracoccaceae bacterium]|jgi:YfiH family protein
MSLEVLKSDDLAPFRHGFFTRKGGSSTGIYAGLNCGAGSADDLEKVRANRKLVADDMGVAYDNLASVNQVHSADVQVIDGPVLGPRPKCDAMVSRTKGQALGILTADCQPVLFADPRAGVVGAAHAGWKGALGGVLEATIDAMVALGATRENINAAIGPSISQLAYEVGPEFFDSFVAHNPNYSRFFSSGVGDRMMFDLPSFGLFRLRGAGIAQASWTGHCTYSDPARFYSYRRTTHAKKADYGRLISVITV